MAEPIGKLMRAGAALGQGKPVSPIASTLREADELSLVLSDAAKELNARMGAQAHLAAIVSSSPSAIVSLSRDGIIRTWNDAATSLFGYAPGEAIGRPVSILAPDDTRGALDKLYASVRSGSTVHADVVRRHGRPPDDVSVSIAPMYDVPAGWSASVDQSRSAIARRASGASGSSCASWRIAQEHAGRGAGDRRADGAQQPEHGGVQVRFSQRRRYGPPRTACCAIGKGGDMPSWWATGAVRRRGVLAHRHGRSGPGLKPDAVHSLTLALSSLPQCRQVRRTIVPEGRVAIAWEPAADRQQLRGGSDELARERGPRRGDPAHEKGLRPRRHLADGMANCCAARWPTMRKTECRGP
jgi:PAS domain S-box-containing protein